MSRSSHSPHHAKLTHNTATPIKRITTAYDTWDYNNHRLWAASASRWTAPEVKSAFSPPLSSTSFVLKGLPQRTPFAIVRTLLGSPLLSALIAQAVHLSALTTQALIRPPRTTTRMEHEGWNRLTTDITLQITTPLARELQRIQNRQGLSSWDKHRPHGPSPSCGSARLDDDDALQASLTQIPVKFIREEGLPPYPAGTSST